MATTLRVKPARRPRYYQGPARVGVVVDRTEIAPGTHHYAVSVQHGASGAKVLLQDVRDSVSPWYGNSAGAYEPGDTVHVQRQGRGLWAIIRKVATPGDYPNPAARIRVGGSTVSTTKYETVQQFGETFVEQNPSEVILHGGEAEVTVGEDGVRIVNDDNAIELEPDGPLRARTMKFKADGKNWFVMVYPEDQLPATQLDLLRSSTPWIDTDLTVPLVETLTITIRTEASGGASHTHIVPAHGHDIMPHYHEILQGEANVGLPIAIDGSSVRYDPVEEDLPPTTPFTVMTSLSGGPTYNRFYVLNGLPAEHSFEFQSIFEVFRGDRAIDSILAGGSVDAYFTGLARVPNPSVVQRGAPAHWLERQMLAGAGARIVNLSTDGKNVYGLWMPGRNARAAAVGISGAVETSQQYADGLTAVAGDLPSLREVDGSGVRPSSATIKEIAVVGGRAAVWPTDAPTPERTWKYGIAVYAIPAEGYTF